MKTKRFPRGLYAPELLEARIAPATIIVTSLADDGSGGTTLREAIVAANLTAAADTITFDPAILPGIITLNGTEIDITSTLTIKGPGVDRLTISGADASRIFAIDDADTTKLHPTTISGLTLRDGNAADEGGAINSKESLSLTNVVIHSNTAANAGGGVYVATVGKVVVNNVKFTDNTATAKAGGGLYAVTSGGILVTRSLVSGNSAAFGGGGLYLRSRDARAAIVVDGSSFIGNSAGQNGSGLHLRNEDTEKMTVKNSTFTGNTAGENGGGLYLSNGLLTVDRTVFSHNSATEDGGAIAGSGGDSLKITNSRFDRNIAAEEGGALDLASGNTVSITGSVFTGNQSTTAGGAISARATVLTVKTSTFASNSATTNGGAISLSGAGTSLVLASSTVSGNAAVDGGGVFADTGAKLTVTGGVFTGNFASDDGGGIHTTGTGVNAVKLSVTGTLFQGNRAASDGGGVFASGDGTVLIKSARALGNQAITGDGGGMYLLSNAAGAGIVGVVVQSSLFQHNVAGDAGGGLSITLLATGTASITGTKILDNLASSTADGGGGLVNFSSAGAVLTIKSSLISGNVAATAGGGLLKGSGTVTLIATVISGNWAPSGPDIFP